MSGRCVHYMVRLKKESVPIDGCCNRIEMESSANNKYPFIEFLYLTIPLTRSCGSVLNINRIQSISYLSQINVSLYRTSEIISGLICRSLISIFSHSMR